MRKPLILCSLVVVLSSAACEQAAAPVGHVEVEPSPIRLLYPGFSEYRLSWSADGALEGLAGQPRVSVHLVGDGGTVLRTFDHALELDWSPGGGGTTRQMLYQSALAPPLAVGTYRLEVGLYDLAGSSWPVTSNEATVVVESSDEGFPAFYFSPEWEPIEGGTDLQILGRRWLRADGVLRLGELTEPGTLWLQLAVPEAIAGEQELQLEAGAERPAVVVHNSCGDVSETLSGSGSHQLLLPIVPPADPTVPPECEISLDANYSLLAVEDRVRRTVGLESLSWLRGTAG